GKTSGALNSGINVSSELRLEVIRESMKRKIVQDQLKNPDVNVFTGVPFDAESFDRDLNFSSLIDVDTDKIREAIRFDAADLEDDFLNALDFSKFNFPAPSIDLSRYLNFDDVLTIPEEDLKELFRSISFDPASFRPLIEDVLKGYGDFLAEKGYLDVDVIFGELRNYFGSESFRQTVNDWIASIEDADDPAETDRLGDLILKDINEYFTSVGLPAFPYVSNSFREYMESDEFRDIVFRDLSELPNLGEVEETVKNYVKDRFLKLFQEKYQEISSAVIRDVQAQLLGSVKGALADMFTGTMEKLGESMEQLVSIDAETFLSAFDVKMSAAEMQAFLSSFTAYAGGSVEKNLSALGYQDPDDPTAIYYYPSSFETKANVLAFLDGYNALMEKQNRAEEKISYTDTLGVVLSTVTEIVDIISYVLIAAVAVSLLVSSIMIGVITYISVLERRKEIGILRALGASKHNVANVFNAETAITGFAAGLLGALLSYALLIPINLILRHATG
ncbi:MAG: ABC transporter permease, partial [Lachnospiraceae bacterium]|nr:ABC transporter permease [Lachnospiraceae bacterium]